MRNDPHFQRLASLIELMIFLIFICPFTLFSTKKKEIKRISVLINFVNLLTQKKLTIKLISFKE